MKWTWNQQRNVLSETKAGVILWSVLWHIHWRRVVFNLTTSQIYHTIRLTSSLRPTTRKCVHLVTCGHFRSRDKDGGHIVWSAISENPMLQTNFMALCFIEPKLLPIEVLHCKIGIFNFFYSCDLDLDPMTFIYELKRYTGRAHTGYELPTSRLSKVIVS